MDVKAAYLNAPIDCEIYMVQPEGYCEPGKENLVCKLQKSLKAKRLKAKRSQLEQHVK